MFARQLSELLKDEDKLALANSYIDSIVESVRQGHDDSKIKKAYNKGPIMIEGAIEVARSRVSVSDKFTRWNRLWLDRYSASYSTPEVVADYRAKRLSSAEIVDVGCGAGMQTVFFSGRSPVTAIEVSPLRAIMARLNALAYGNTPKKVINADYAQVIENLDLDLNTVIFSDPLRPRTEVERSLASLIPSPLVIRKLVAGKTERFAFDLPPQISWENISLKGEKEYISVDSSLNRLTLYQGDLQRSETSAVILPKKALIRGTPDTEYFRESNEASSFIYIPDISLIYARLLHTVTKLGEFLLLSRDKRRTVLTGQEALPYYFPGEVFSVLDTAEHDELQAKLSNLDCGKAVLRYSIDPNEYYRERSNIEENLTGNSELHLFKSNSKYIICEKDTQNSDRPMDRDLVGKVD